jgi:hypothetical protein
MSIPLITAFPNQSMDQTTFDATLAAWILQNAALPPAINAAMAALSLMAAGGGLSIPYIFDTTVTDTDPGPGYLRLSASPQNTATTLRLDLVGADMLTYTALIDSMASSSSAVKGQIRLVKLADPTKWLSFNLTAVASPTGYKNLTIAPVSGSAVSPFVAGDSLVLQFSRTGDVGTAGSILRRVSSVTSSSTPTPSSATDDLYAITALAVAPTIGAPTGTPLDGQGLLFRIKDNGTARALAWNAVFRPSTDLPLPTSTTTGKWTYIGFIYNATDFKWDIAGVLGNI